MGPHVSDDLSEWTLKPFQSSTTFRNLHGRHRCVINVVDDALLLANAVLGNANDSPSLWTDGLGYVLDGSCHWYALSIKDWDITQPRAIATCLVCSTGSKRSFFGWNRAKHAVVELAILTSRIGLLESAYLESEIARLRVLIDKTAGERENLAFQLLVEHIQRHA